MLRSGTSLPAIVGQYWYRSDITTTYCFEQTDFSQFDSKHDIMSLPSVGCARQDQLGATCVGPTFSVPWVCRSCQCNAVNALVMRHGVTQPLVRRKLTRSHRFASLISGVYGSLLVSYYDQWIYKWPLSKQIAIKYSDRHDRFAPGKVKSFVKREVVTDEPSRPRLIQGYKTLTTQARFGPEFTVFQKALVTVCDRFEIFPGITITMASGMNADALAQWMELSLLSCRRRPYFIERDGKNWDATMQKMHHLTKLFYMRYCSPQLASFVEKGFRSVGTVLGEQGRLIYRLNGTVKSGHNDTTSGNSLINMLICADTLRLCGLSGHVIVAGDDALIVVDGKPDLDLYLSVEKDFGIVPKARLFTDVIDVSFVSGHWVPIGDGHFIFAPFLGRLLSKLWWTVSPPAAKKIDDYRYSVVMGLSRTCGRLPLFSHFLNIVVTRNARVMPIDKWKYSPYVGGADYCVNFQVALTSMAKRYTLTTTQLLGFASFLSKLSPHPTYVYHPVGARILEVDCASLLDRYGAPD